MTKRKIQNIWKLCNIVLWCLAIYFMCAIEDLNLISNIKVVLIALLITVICVGLEIMQKHTKKRFLIYASRILTIVFSALFFFASCYVCQLKENMNVVADEVIQYDHVVLVANKDAEIDLENINDYNVATLKDRESNGLNEAKDLLEKETKKVIDFVESENMFDLCQGLLTNEFDLILYNQAYISFIQEDVAEFEYQTKIIREYQLLKSDVDPVVDELIFEANNELNNGTVINENIQIDETEKTNNKKIQYIPGKDTISVYISGIDVYGDIATTSRSDVNIFATINPNTRQILLVTTPRDYFVKIPNVSGDKRDKLTHAGLYGVNASMNTLSSIYGVELDYYLRVNFTSVENIVDALGGLNVYSEYEFTTGDGIEIKRGYNRLDGKQTLRFCRQRYDLPGGDNQRGKNQMEVIKAIAKKLTGPTILLNANKLLETMQGNMDMNIPYELIQTLIKDEMGNVKDWEIKMIAAEGTDSKSVTYSAPGMELYVMEPDMLSVYNIQSDLIKINSGKLLDDTISFKDVQE